MGEIAAPLGRSQYRSTLPGIWFEQISGPYLGETPAALRTKLKVLEKGCNLVVAEHRTKLPLMDAVTVEAVQFDPPGRISFRLLQGPVPQVSEELLLKEIGSEMALSYRGELGAVWGTKFRLPSSRSTLVLMDQPAEDVATFQSNRAPGG